MYNIGVDIGGTRIKIGVVDIQGNIVYRDGCSTDVKGGFKKIISDINEVIRRIIKQNSIEPSQIRTIGFGLPGYVDKNGKANCVNLNWNKVDFIKSLKDTFKEFNILAENDATVAGLAESEFGSAKNSSSSVLLTLGTGVGGGIVINGRPFSGAHGVGSEIGHMIIGENFYDCNCGNNGCFETFCSATGIIKYAQKLLSEENASKSVIFDMCKRDLSQIDAKIVFDVYRQDDQIAKEVIGRFKKYLAIGIANIVNTLDPEVVAIGGGLSKSSDIILDGLKEMVKEHITYKDEEFADIVIATLGNDAGIIGASILK